MANKENIVDSNSKLFDAYCKKILKNEMISHFRHNQYRMSKEISLDELTEKDLASLSIEDKYFVRAYMIDELNISVIVENQILISLLEELQELEQRIILLYYFVDLNDKEISEALGKTRQTIQYQRNLILKKLNAILSQKDL